jgi:hypothetical protein
MHACARTDTHALHWHSSPPAGHDSMQTLYSREPWLNVRKGLHLVQTTISMEKLKGSKRTCGTIPHAPSSINLAAVLVPHHKASAQRKAGLEVRLCTLGTAQMIAVLMHGEPRLPGWPSAQYLTAPQTSPRWDSSAREAWPINHGSLLLWLLLWVLERTTERMIKSRKGKHTTRVRARAHTALLH